MASTHPGKTLPSSISWESAQIYCTLLSIDNLTIQQQEQRISCPDINSWSNHICNTLSTSDSSYHKKDVNEEVTEKDSKRLQTHGTD